MMKRACVWHKIAWILIIIGGLNWGLVGAFNWNLVHAILGPWMLVERIVYVLVGLAAIFALFPGKCMACETAAKMGNKPQGGGMQSGSGM